MLEEDLEAFQELIGRNNVHFAYSDREIEAVNSARNKQDGYHCHDKFGILCKDNDEFLKDAEGRSIMELPACEAIGSHSPISIFLDKFKEFDELTSSTEEKLYPIKILFPYKTLDKWHWNVGEIVVEKDENEKVTVTATAFDPQGVGSLDDMIQQEINDFFAEYFAEKSFEFKLEKTNFGSVQTNQACGLYVALAMHNLKTKPSDQVWDGVLDANGMHREEEDLRDEDSELIVSYNRTAIATFCAAIVEPEPKKSVVEKKRTAVKSADIVQEFGSLKKLIINECFDENAEIVENYAITLKFESQEKPTIYCCTNEDGVEKLVRDKFVKMSLENFRQEVRDFKKEFLQRSFETDSERFRWAFMYDYDVEFIVGIKPSTEYEYQDYAMIANFRSDSQEESDKVANIWNQMGTEEAKNDFIDRELGNAKRSNPKPNEVSNPKAAVVDVSCELNLAYGK